MTKKAKAEKTAEMLREEAKEIMTKAKTAAKKKLDEAAKLERAKTDLLVSKILAAGKIGELEKFAQQVCGEGTAKGGKA